MKYNYLVSVFVDGKNVNSYFSDNLDDLVTIKALHKDCVISIFDIINFTQFTDVQVSNEIVRSGIRWKEAVDNAHKENDIETEETTVVQKRKVNKVSKYWDRPVKCVETGQVFKSIRECSDHLGISYKSVWNALNSGNGRCCLHFINVHDMVKE